MCNIADVLRSLHLYCVHHDELTPDQRDHCVRILASRGGQASHPAIEIMYHQLCRCPLEPSDASATDHRLPT